MHHRAGGEGYTYCFGFVPKGQLSHIVFGTSRQLQIKLIAEDAINVLHEKQAIVDFRFDLIAG